MKREFRLGDPVLIIFDERRRWIRKVADEEFHCNFGFINLGDVVGMRYGSTINTNKEVTLQLVPPLLLDWIIDFKHESQVIYEKDAAPIILLLDIKPNDVVFEVGTGSGALTAVLARYVGENGKVITHEKREHAFNIAQRNINTIGLQNVEFHLRDVISEGFSEGLADAIMLDLGDPWQVIQHVSKTLVPGGRIAIFIPTFNQLEKTMLALEECNFANIKTQELMQREIQMKKDAIRPATRMIGHTGFLMSATYLG
jgi:tRNA (adenine57-N1/adenine58-N1)-methyltransferase